MAVRLVSIARFGRTVENGPLIFGIDPRQVTPQSIKSGLPAVKNRVSLLKRSRQLFEFLAHVEGQHSIEVHFGPGDEDSRLQQLADALADEVRCLAVHSASSR